MWIIPSYCLVMLLMVAPCVAAPGPKQPVLGYSNWNNFRNKINSSLFRDTAAFMKKSGLLAAGYNYITLGGIGYANGSTWPDSQQGWGPSGPGNITRNATGHLQVDPVRFPGGNEGLRRLTNEFRAMGFKWGHYTEAGTTGCNGARGSSEGYEIQDAAFFFFGDLKSEYLMVDSCGIKAQAPPHGPPADWPPCPSNAPGCGPLAAQAMWEMTLWRDMIDAAVAKGAPPIVLHDCHNGCASAFGGPTLAVAPCDVNDPAQHWSLPLNGGAAGLTDGAFGKCAGCASSPSADAHRNVSATSCGNNAEDRSPGWKPGDADVYGVLGLGLQACLLGSGQNGAMSSEPVSHPQGLGAYAQLWNYSALKGTINNVCRPHDVGCVHAPPCLARAFGTGPAVVMTRDTARCTNATASGWQPKSIPSSTALHQFVAQSAGGEAMCLTSAGPVSEVPVDPWCIANNNMWRSNTDVLQTWTRIMIEVESVATQGHISRPGAWSFPDCLELGVAGQGTLTWEESKSNLALFAVTSSPLILGNDAREGRMQQRLVDLLTNADMLNVNQQYNPDMRFAGGRLASWPLARELWAKPLLNSTAAVVLFNRAGTVIGETPEGADPKPPYCSDPNSTLGPCNGCFINDDQPWLAPCDDNVTASTGAQTLSLNLDMLPREWLVSGHQDGSIECDFFDIFATTNKGAPLGRFRTWSAVIPPHGVRFLRLTNCALSVESQETLV